MRKKSKMQSSIYLVCFRPQTALSLLKEQFPVKLMSSLLLWSLCTLKNISFPSRDLWSVSQSPRNTNTVGRFQSEEHFLNNCVGHTASLPTCPMILTLFQWAEAGISNAWLHRLVMELTSARVHFQTSWPEECSYEQPWSPGCVLAC